MLGRKDAKINYGAPGYHRKSLCTVNREFTLACESPREDRPNLKRVWGSKLGKKACGARLPKCQASQQLFGALIKLWQGHSPRGHCPKALLDIYQT
jgi:hypothetical protein